MRPFKFGQLAPNHSIGNPTSIAAGTRKEPVRRKKARESAMLSELEAVSVLKNIEKGWSISRSCREAGISSKIWHHNYRLFPGLKERAEEAYRIGTEALEDEATRRAVEGVSKTKGIYWQGVMVGTETTITYSDLLLIFILKARHPEKFRDKWEFNQVNLARIRPEDVKAYETLSDEELETMLRLQAKVREGAVEGEGRLLPERGLSGETPKEGEKAGSHNKDLSG